MTATDTDIDHTKGAGGMTRSRQIWTSIVTSFALFMVTLDNLVVTTALPSIRVDLDASLASLGWTVNAYTLAFAVLLLPAAAIGDRLGRRRVFTAGLGLFTLASAAAALAPSADALIAARALQGAGAAGRRHPRLLNRGREDGLVRSFFLPTE